MRFKYFCILSFLLFIGFTNSNSLFAYKKVEIIAEISDDIVIHTVAKGETVYSIAAAYHTTEADIYKLNPKAEKGIKIGDKLKVQPLTKVTGYSDHLIEAKETLFSVSRMYGLSVDHLKKANLGLNETTFKIGKKIRIPKFTEPDTDDAAEGNAQKYIVQKKETLYSISKAYNISVDDIKQVNPSLSNSGLKEGMALTIPTAGNVLTNTYNPEPTIETPSATQGEVVRVGVLLPFLDEKGSVSRDKLAEYYEGFLLAVKALKERGLNAEIYTFDIGAEKSTKKLESLLETNELKNLHLMIGGVSKSQIDILTKFSKKTGIKYVIPFGTSHDINSTPTVFQITSSHTSLYAEAVQAFKDQYKGYNVIFVSESGSKNDKADFVNELKKELSKSNIAYKTTASSDDLANDITNILDMSKKNVLVPTSSSEITLRRVIAAANSLDIDRQGVISLFGYPDWQAYTQHWTALHKFDSRIYSIFFIDKQEKEVQAFSQDFKGWYNKSLIFNFPVYGYLGYDMGLYFLTALQRYGSNFEDNVSELRVASLQSAIHFKRTNNKSGFINNGLYFVHFTTGLSIEKTSIGK